MAPMPSYVPFTVRKLNFNFNFCKTYAIISHATKNAPSFGPFILNPNYFPQFVTSTWARQSTCKLECPNIPHYGGVDRGTSTTNIAETRLHGVGM